MVGAFVKSGTYDREWPITLAIDCNPLHRSNLDQALKMETLPGCLNNFRDLVVAALVVACAFVRCLVESS